MSQQPQELRGVVDENDQPGAAGPQQNQETFDWDDKFAYSTDKIVRIRDFKLGLLYWSIVSLILMYIIIVVFNIEGRQMTELPGYGTVMTRFKGKGISNDKVYDETDLRHPVIEPTGVFVMTKRIVLKGQKRGKCVDMDFPAPCPCREGDECVDGFCETAGWCPSLGDANARAPPRGAIIEHFEGLEHGLFQIQTSITFPHLGNAIYIQGKSQGASNKYEAITLEELVSEAEPKVNLTDVFEKGALFGFSAKWTCDVSYADCEPDVGIKHLDGGEGFSQKRATYRKENGQEVRDATYMYGLRIVVDSIGTGKKVSLTLIVIQIGAGIALLRTAVMITDWVMLHMFGDKRTGLYLKCKVQQTQDYSDLQDRINLIEAHKQAQTTLIGSTQQKISGSNLVSRAAGARGAGLRGRG